MSLVLTVSTESLAVLSAALAASERTVWLLDAALAPFLLGLAFYVFVICRFDLRQLAVGRGDHWITGGALAISTLAAGRITLAASEPAPAGRPRERSRTIAVVLWALTIAWLPVLLAAEALRPRLALRRPALVDRVPRRHVRRVQLRRRRRRQRASDHRLRARLGVGRVRRVAGRARRDAPARAPAPAQLAVMGGPIHGWPCPTQCAVRSLRMNAA